MKNAAKFADYVPVGAIILGFAAIAAGWNGAAGVDYTQGQIPYLISGGLVGVGFVFFGTAAMLVRTIKKGQSRQEEMLGELINTMRQMASVFTISSNGHSDKGLELDLVVSGSSSFHLPNCKMVGNREGTLKITREEAIAEGLEPCRVCNPLGAETSSAH